MIFIAEHILNDFKETRIKCLQLNVRSKMRLSQRLKLCVNTFFIFSHLMTFYLPYSLTLIIIFHLGNLQILKESISRNFFVKHLLQMPFLQGLSIAFMIVYILLHLMTFDLNLLALKVIFHLGNIQTMKKAMSRVLTTYKQ